MLGGEGPSTTCCSLRGNLPRRSRPPPRHRHPRRRLTLQYKAYSPADSHDDRYGACVNSSPRHYNSSPSHIDTRARLTPIFSNASDLQSSIADLAFRSVPFTNYTSPASWQAVAGSWFVAGLLPSKEALEQGVMGANFSRTGTGEVAQALALALALKGEVPKCLPCALPGSAHLHSTTRTSCDTAGTGRIPNLIHQMEFLPPKSRTDLLGLTAHTKRLHADWYCPPVAQLE